VDTRGPDAPPFRVGPRRDVMIVGRGMAVTILEGVVNRLREVQDRIERADGG